MPLPRPLLLSTVLVVDSSAFCATGVLIDQMERAAHLAVLLDDRITVKWNRTEQAILNNDMAQVERVPK
jgi:hypothetical protein